MKVTASAPCSIQQTRSVLRNCCAAFSLVGIGIPGQYGTGDPDVTPRSSATLIMGHAKAASALCHHDSGSHGADNATRDLAHWEGGFRIHEGIRTKLTVPLRCDPLLCASPPKQCDGEEQIVPLHVEQRHPKWPEIYGAVDVESGTQESLGPDAALDIGVLCSLIATAISLIQQERAVMGRLLKGMTEAMERILRGPDVPRENWTDEMGPWRDFPLNELCKMAADENDPFFEGVDRCDVYRYDHVRDGFEILGHNCYADLTDKAFDPLYLLPRKGGNSERILAHNDAALFIPDAKTHKRVSGFTSRYMRAMSLVGAPFRLSSSFRTEGVIWLASHEKQLKRDYLSDENTLSRLQLFSAAVAMLAVTLRIAGAKPE